MKRLFLWLVNELNIVGDISEANMYGTGDFSSVTVKIAGIKYTINVRKEDANGND